MVDPVNLIFRESFAYFFVKLFRTRQIMAERFFNDETGPAICRCDTFVLSDFAIVPKTQEPSPSKTFCCSGFHMYVQADQAGHSAPDRNPDSLHQTDGNKMRCEIVYVFCPAEETDVLTVSRRSSFDQGLLPTPTTANSSPI